MFIIRKKDNHKILKAFGHTTELTGLGEFDPEIWEGLEVDTLPEDHERYVPKPFATGKDLINFIENYNSNLTDAEVRSLYSKLAEFLFILKQPRCNPLTEEKLNTELAVLFKTSTLKQQAVIKKVIDDYKKGVEFVKQSLNLC